MKSKKHRLSGIVFYSVIIALALVLPNMAFALQAGDFYYSVYGGTVTITGYTCPDGPAVIPATIDNMPVTGIAGYPGFTGCDGLTSLTIPDSVARIGPGSFSSCDSLTNVTIGSGDTSIGNFAFSYCDSLTAIVVNANNPAYSSQDGVLYNKVKTVLMLYPAKKSGAFTIPDSVTSIGDSAFRDCAGLTNVTIGSGVTSIGAGAFSSCAALTTAYFLGNAPSMGANVFLDCLSTFSVCYTAGSTGFTTPWCPTYDQCYPAAACAETTTTTTTKPKPCAAEAIYGENSEQTELLRKYRDTVLSKTPEGQEIIKTYYKFSPPVTKLLEQRPLLKNRAKAFIDSMLPGIMKKVEESDKEQ